MRIRAGFLIALAGLILIGGHVSAVHFDDQGIFTANQGQWDDSILFRCDSPDGVMWITASSRYYQLFRTDETADRAAAMSPQSLRMRLDSSYQPPVTYTRLVEAKLVGANSRAVKYEEGESLYPTHFYLTNDKSRWQTNVPSYSAVTIESVYDGIDCRYYFRDGQLEYDFIVAPGADVDMIRLAYEGVDDIAIDSDGNLELITPWGSIVEHAPVAYQEINGKRRKVQVAYVLADEHTVTLELAGYDPAVELIIDPVLVGTAFVGGTGNDQHPKIAVDSNSNVYLIGTTMSIDFPQLNYIDSIPAERHVVAISYDSTLTVIRFVLYFGSADYYTLVQKIEIAPDGSIWASGDMNSGDLPLINAFDSVSAGQECWLVHWGAAGDTLLLSSYVGGSSHDWGLRLRISESGSVYGSGATGSSDFPGIGGLSSGGDDVFLMRLNQEGNQIERGIRIGGNRDEYGMDLALGNDGMIYLSGRTYSVDFPAVGAFAHPRLDSVDADIFVMKLDSAWNTLFSVCFGGKGFDGVNFMSVDSNGSVLITGAVHDPSTTLQGGYPLVNEYQGYTNIFQMAFVSKLNAAGTDFEFSTLLGGDDLQTGIKVDVDRSGYVWVSGSTASPDFPVVNSIMPFNSTWYMAFLTLFTPDGRYVPFSTFWGTGENTYGWELAIDRHDNLYMCGSAWSEATGSDLYVTRFKIDGGCCYGMRGEIDGHYGPLAFDPNISDLIYLIDYVFRSGPMPSCYDEADVVVSQNTGLNIEDIIYMVDFLFRGGPEPPPCPAE